MNVSLTTELEKFVHSKVDSGYYQNASEVVRSALRLMKDRDTAREQSLTWLQREVDSGWDQARTGNVASPEEVKSSMATFKKKWKNGRHSAAK